MAVSRAPSSSATCSGFNRWHSASRSASNRRGAASRAKETMCASCARSGSLRRGNRRCISANTRRWAAETEPSRTASAITGWARSWAPVSRTPRMAPRESLLRPTSHPRAWRAASAAQAPEVEKRSAVRAWTALRRRAWQPSARVASPKPTDDASDNSTSLRASMACSKSARPWAKRSSGVVTVDSYMCSILRETSDICQAPKPAFVLGNNSFS